jgi:hypothetical protein
MNYNLVDELAKLRITLPFMEVFKIPQQRENLLKILDDTNSRIKATVMNTRQQKNCHISKAKRQSSTILYIFRKSRFYIT